MLRMPVMVAAGGVNSAGRTSRRHAYRRMVWDHLSADDRAGTESALAQMMGTQDSSLIRHHTLVREIEADWFDHRAVPWHRRATIAAGQSDQCFEYNAGAMSDGTVIGGGAQVVEGKP